MNNGLSLPNIITVFWGIHISGQKLMYDVTVSARSCVFKSPSQYMLNTIEDAEWTAGPIACYCERRISHFSVSGNTTAGDRPRRGRRSQEARVVSHDSTVANV